MGCKCEKCGQMCDCGERFCNICFLDTLDSPEKKNLYLGGRFYDKEGTLNQKDTIEDGFGSIWSAWCPFCGKKSMQVVRPGQIQCSNCEGRARMYPSKCD